VIGNAFQKIRFSGNSFLLTVQWAGKRCSQTTCCQKETSSGLVQDHVVNPAGSILKPKKCGFRKQKKRERKNESLEKKSEKNSERNGSEWV
jgi:hypothetical protein